MSIIIEELAKLMYDNYQTAAVNRGWHPNTHSPLAWAFVPEENKAAWRDAAVVIESIIREDERAKYSTEEIQSDIRSIMKALDLSTRPRPYPTSDVVENEILPKIRKMKKTFFDVREALGKNFAEINEMLDGRR
jgi:hypothetical protein